MRFVSEKDHLLACLNFYFYRQFALYAFYYMHLQFKISYDVICDYAWSEDIYTHN